MVDMAGRARVWKSGVGVPDEKPARVSTEATERMPLGAERRAFKVVQGAGKWGSVTVRVSCASRQRLASRGSEKRRGDTFRFIIWFELRRQECMW